MSKKKRTPRAKIRKTTRSERTKARYKYMLLADYTYQTKIFPEETVRSPHIAWYTKIETDGLLSIRKGYRWDGCSGPTWDDKSNATACLIHDAEYQLIRTDKLPPNARRLADRDLYDVMMEHGEVRPQKVETKDLPRWMRWRPLSWLAKGLVNGTTATLGAAANVGRKVRASYYHQAVRRFGGDASRRRYHKLSRKV